MTKEDTIDRLTVLLTLTIKGKMNMMQLRLFKNTLDLLNPDQSEALDILMQDLEDIETLKINKENLEATVSTGVEGIFND